MRLSPQRAGHRRRRPPRAIARRSQDKRLDHIGSAKLFCVVRAAYRWGIVCVCCVCTVLCHLVLCVLRVVSVTVCVVLFVSVTCVCVCPPSPLAAGACGSGLNQVLCFVLSVLCCFFCTAAPHVFHSLPSSVTRPSKARKRSRGAARLACHTNMDSSTSNSVSPSMEKKSKGQSKMRARKARTA